MPVERGRLVFDVALDGLAGQRSTRQVGDIAGLPVLIDGRLVAGLPTTRDGPAAGGNYQFGMSVNALTSGSHVIEVRVYGTESGTRYAQHLDHFQLRFAATSGGPQTLRTTAVPHLGAQP